MNTKLTTTRLYEQVDVSGSHVYYSWMLDGAKKSQSPGSGWKWIKGAGCRGVHTTRDISLVIAFAARHGLTIQSNGTHTVHSVPMSSAAAIVS